MTIGRTLWSGLILSLSLAAQPSVATVIEYDIINTAGNEWRYDYTVTNDGVSAIEEFTIFFGLGLYENLSVFASPATWDSLVTQSDPNLPDDGFFDSLALSGGLAPGASLGGFSVLFTWLGQGTPGSQTFDVVDPLTIETLESGRTIQRQQPNDVPEPGTLALLGLGLLSLVSMRRRISA